jgi:hypothetical protein
VPSQSEFGKAEARRGGRRVRVAWLLHYGNLAARQRVPASPTTHVLGSSVARGERFRIELYIDVGDRERNVAILNALREQSEALEQVRGPEDPDGGRR